MFVANAFSFLKFKVSFHGKFKCSVIVRWSLCSGQKTFLSKTDSSHLLIFVSILMWDFSSKFSSLWRKLAQTFLKSWFILCFCFLSGLIFFWFIFINCLYLLLISSLLVFQYRLWVCVCVKVSDWKIGFLMWRNWFQFNWSKEKRKVYRFQRSLSLNVTKYSQAPCFIILAFNFSKWFFIVLTRNTIWCFKFQWFQTFSFRQRL